MNVKKTKILVFEARKSSHTSFYFNGDIIDQVDEFKYLGILMHGTKGLSPAIEYLCKAAKRAMFGLQRRCQQLSIHDPVLKCKLFDTLVKPIFYYCCEVWSVLGSKTAKCCLRTCEHGPNTDWLLEDSAWGPGAYDHEDAARLGRVWAISTAHYMAVTSSSCQVPAAI